MEFNEKEIIREIGFYVNTAYNKPDHNYNRKKIFYGLKYLQGWRFYLKAFWYRDWSSIKSHIKHIYLTK